MNECPAWKLSVGEDLAVVIGRRELIHLVPDAVVLEVPRTRAHCSVATVWQGHVVPVYDLAVRFGGEKQNIRLVAIVGYQSRPGQAPFFGAFRLIEPPAGITVSNQDACHRPADAEAWLGLAQVWVESEGKPTPILDLARIFGGEAH